MFLTGEEQKNTKRIAKNTLLLYLRMLVTMIVGLYTSRVVLQNLGVEDYGIYNVVGGAVALFSILSASLSAAINRFLTFELGKNNLGKLNKVFSSAITIQFFLGILVVFLAETIGLWFLNYKMTVPLERLYAANWVYQLSTLTFVVNLISVPYNAVIIAHERMSAFAYISIIEALGKLVVAWMIAFSCGDKMIYYSVLMCVMALTIRIIYGIYCRRYFEECIYHFVFDGNLLKEMFGFAGWNFIGASSAIMRDHGVGIALNIFLGPSVNAARGIAIQVQNAVSVFSANFMTAMNPQITKSYANGNHSYMMSLIFQGARLSFFMLLFFSLPIILNTDYILACWLTIVPEYTKRFIQLILVFILSESVSTPLITAMLATGKIRKYQIVVGGLQMLNLPISYVFLKHGFIPECTLAIAIVISQFCLLTRLVLLKKMILLKMGEFFKCVYLNAVFVAALSAMLPLILKKFVFFNSSFIDFVVLSFVSLVWTSFVIFKIGCNANERFFIKNKFTLLIRKITHI